MRVKKNFAIAAVVALLAVPAVSMINVNAADLELEQYNTPWEQKTGTGSWTASPKGTRPNPDGGRPIDIPATRTFYKNGHSFTVESEEGTKGKIIGMDGNDNVSNAQILAALEGQSSSSNNTQQAYNNKKKLVQTGQNHSDAKKAGVFAAIVVVLGGAFAFISKHFKRA